MTDSQGDACLSGKTTPGANLSTTVTYRRGGQRWRITRAGDMSWKIRCPSGRVERYTAEELAAGGCGPVVECAFGSCP